MTPVDLLWIYFPQIFAFQISCYLFYLQKTYDDPYDKQLMGHVYDTIAAIGYFWSPSDGRKGWIGAAGKKEIRFHEHGTHIMTHPRMKEERGKRDSTKPHTDDYDHEHCFQSLADRLSTLATNEYLCI